MEWIAKINWVDALFLIIILRSVYLGLQRGFFTCVFNTLAMAVAIILSVCFYSQIGAAVSKYAYLPPNISNIVSFLLIAFLVRLFFRFVAAFFKKILKVEVLPDASRKANMFSGPVAGFFEGATVSLFVFLVLLLTPINYVVSSAKDNSLSGRFFARTAALLYEKVSKIIPSAQEADINSLLAGAEPLEFKLFQPKNSNKLDDVTN